MTMTLLEKNSAGDELTSRETERFTPQFIWSCLRPLTEAPGSR